VNPSQAKSVVLVRAVELADREGLLLPRAARERCTLEAGPPQPGEGAASAAGDSLTAEEESFLVRRAALLEAELRGRDRDLPIDAGGTPLRRVLTPSLMVLAFVAGFVLYRVSPDKRINLLAFPLLGLIAWNVAVYGWLLANRLRAGDGTQVPGPLRSGLGSWLARLRLPRLQAGKGDDPRAAVAGGAMAQFTRDWLPIVAPLALARARTVLHAAALAVALGAVTSLVFRGLYLEYLAGWESTFLDAATVHSVLAFVLAPASVVTGIEVPDATAIEALRFRPGFAGENASRWIALYVVAVVLYVGIPRVLLLAWCTAAERRAGHDLYRPLPTDPYFRRLLQSQRGGGEVAAVLWHGVEPSPPLRARVREALLEELGGRVRLEMLDPLEYGEEASVQERLAAHDPRERVAVVFSLAATPEEEVQGLLLRQLAGGERPPLVLLDAAPLERFRADEALRRRFDERLRAWQRFATDHGAGHVLVGPEEGSGT